MTPAAHARVLRLDQQRADQHVRAARLIDHGGAESVVLLAKHLELVGDRARPEFGPAGDDDPRGFAAGMGVDDRNAPHGHSRW